MALKRALNRRSRTSAGKEEQQQSLMISTSDLKDKLDQLMMLFVGKPIKILLIGKTGVGKSHLTNALIGEQLAEEGKDFDPKTAEVSAYEFVKNNVDITVFDTPGLADTRGNDEEYLRKIKEKGIELDLILFCTEMNGTRFRNDDLETMKKLSMALGPQIWNHAVIVLTFANMVFASPSEKANGVSDEEVFGEKFRCLKKTFLEALIHDCEVPDEGATEVPFVPTGDSMEPRLPDRNDWMTTFWVTAFNRIKGEAKVAFFLSSADRLSFPKPHSSNFEEDHIERAARRSLKHTFRKVTSAIDVYVPSKHGEAGRLLQGKTSQRLVSPSIQLDEGSSQRVFKDILGDATDSTGEAVKSSFVRYYQTFLRLIIKYVKRVLRSSKRKEESTERQGPTK